MNPLAAEGPAIAFIGLAVLTLLIGTFRNVSWGILTLWLVALGAWAAVSAPVGWVLLLACLAAACLMPPRTRKPAEVVSPPPPPPAPAPAPERQPAPSWDERARRVPRAEGPQSTWEQMHN